MGRSDTNMITLEDYIKALKESNDVDMSMEIKNKKNNQIGVASFTYDNRIAIYEGDPDGKDDHICSINEFKRNYEITKILDACLDDYLTEIEVEEID